MATLEDLKDILERIDKKFEKANEEKDKTEKKEKEKAKSEKAPGRFDAIKNLYSNVQQIHRGNLSAVGHLPKNIGTLFKTFTAPTGKQQSKSPTPLLDLMRNVRLIYRSFREAFKRQSVATEGITQPLGKVVSGEVSAPGGEAPAGVPGGMRAVASRLMETLRSAGKSVFNFGKSLIQGGGQAAAGGARAVGAGAAEAGVAAEAGAAGAAEAGAAGVAGAGAGIAALASNPVGWVIAAVLAIAAVVAALAAVPVLMKQWGESVLESQRKFAEVSGAMAAVFAKWDVFQIHQGITVGNALAPSAARLEESLEKLVTFIQPYLIGMLTALNYLVAASVTTTTWIFGFLEDALVLILNGLGVMGLGIPGLGKILQAILDTLRKAEGGSAATFLNDNILQYNERRRTGVIRPATA